MIRRYKKTRHGKNKSITGTERGEDRTGKGWKEFERVAERNSERGPFQQ